MSLLMLGTRFATARLSVPPSSLYAGGRRSVRFTTVTRGPGTVPGTYVGLHGCFLDASSERGSVPRSAGIAL